MAMPDMIAVIVSCVATSPNTFLKNPRCTRPSHWDTELPYAKSSASSSKPTCFEGQACAAESRAIARGGRGRRMSRLNTSNPVNTPRAGAARACSPGTWYEDVGVIGLLSACADAAGVLMGCPGA